MRTSRAPARTRNGRNNIGEHQMETDSLWNTYTYATIAVVGLVLYFLYTYVMNSGILYVRALFRSNSNGLAPSTCLYIPVGMYGQ